MGSHSLLINLLVILVSILIIQLWMNKRDLKKIELELIIFVSFGAAILFCMKYPFIISDGILCDLRNIPFLLACFYAHRMTGLGLAFIIIFARFFYGGTGAWLNLGLTPFIFCIAMLLRPYFERSRLIIKVSIPTILMGVLSVFILIVIKYGYDVPVPKDLWFSFTGIQMVGILLSMFMAEMIRSQRLLLFKLIRMEKLEAVSHLAASIAHEVRNPLTSSRGFLQLGTESKQIPDVEKQYLMQALNGIDRAEEIIKDYLAFAKPVHENIDEVNIQEVLERSLTLIQPLANMNTINVVPDIRPCMIKGNPSYFQQAIINLLKNGIEAMPDGGTLEIKMKEALKYVTLTIRDQGIGMDPEQVQRLGEPYFSTKESKGTGLGMMVVFRVIESMGGKIQINSQIGQGTEITLKLPLFNHAASPSK